MTKEQKQSFSNRVTALQIFFGGFIALILLRLFIITVSDHNYYKALAENQHNFEQKLQPTRGEIFITDKYSSDPYPVATNNIQNLVYVNPKEITDFQSESQSLASILGIDQPTVLKKISDTSRDYVALMHQLSDQQSSEISAAKLAGVYLSPETNRYYPEGDFLSQVLGFVGFDQSGMNKIGLYGIEKSFDKDLAGTQGEVSTEADVRGDWITGSDRTFTPAVDGSGLVLTIDRSIQHEVEDVLKQTVQQHGADSANVIVANPKTGAILAMATYPSFDLNQYNKAADPSVYLNGATFENYEPGSTMKAVTLGSALDQGLITPDTTYTDTGEVDISGYKIKNSDLKAHGVTTMTDVIDHSLNTGAIWVEQQLGNYNFVNYLKNFGFGQPTGVGVSEASGDMNSVMSGRQINLFTASFGQGIAVTPIQMLQAYTAFANGGKMMQPYLVDSKILPDGSVQKTQPKMVRQVISAQAAQSMTQMLVDDVENGYGKAAGVKGYFIAGKTGTAQIPTKGGYDPYANIGSFVGYGPAENPQFVMIININHPRDVKFAESTAAPAFGQIANFILNYYQIAPTRQ